MAEREGGREGGREERGKGKVGACREGGRKGGEGREEETMQ